MAIATFASPAGGSSAVPEKRVANFHDDSSDEELEGEMANGLSNSPVRSNGKAIGSALKKGDKGTKRRKAENDDTDSARTARKAEAEKLYEVRRELPFYQGRQMIMEEIMKHETTIIIGETGCGKSTQLPQLLRTHPTSLNHFSPDDSHASRFMRGPSIAITQPRRLPTISLAQRVSTEMGCLLGSEVGYSVRFEDMTGYSTKVRYLTEGVLMRELAMGQKGAGEEDKKGESSKASKSNDNVPDEQLNLLLRYDIVVIDEAHERTLNTDFLCGTLKRIQRIRRELSQKAIQSTSINGEVKGKGKAREGVRPLKIVIMSATLDPGKFSAFFETGRDALLVKGRMYEVATHHVHAAVDDYIESAAKSVLQIHCRKGAEGDVLVFMPGSEEIENCCELLRRADSELPEDQMKLQVLPLYASLPPTAQIKIFAPLPPNTRRVVVATNIAETSMTIPGVSFVIDSGYKKEKEFIFRASGAMEHLAKKEISKAAAWQRTGRAGRERNGECYRLYPQSGFAKFKDFDAPEIQRCNLASAILQLVAMGLDPFEFEFIDNPGREPISAAFQTLAGLGALDSPTSITRLGREMLLYPLDPSHARILVASFEMGCQAEVIDVLSILNSGTIWVDRSSDRDAIAVARAKFVNRDGDHLTALNVFRAYLDLKAQNASTGTTGRSGKGKKSLGGGTNLVRWCKDNFVNSKTLLSATKIRNQLRELALKNGKDPKVSCGSETSLVNRCLLQGLFMNTAVIQANGSYKQTAGSLEVKIHPSSILMGKRVPAIVYDELAITTAFYARNVSSFDQSWLADIPLFQQANLKTTEAITRSSNL